MRVYFTNVLMIALSVAFLTHFALIVKYGGYQIQEPNMTILISEIAMFFGIIGFGVSNLCSRN